MEDVEALVYHAKLSEHTERYAEMAQSMKAVVEAKRKLTVDERNLVSVAYKNKIGSKRSSWRLCSAIEQTEKEHGDVEKFELAAKYRQLLEKELNEVVDEVHRVVDILMADTLPDDSKVFYSKMKGDYYRYKAEFSTGAERADAAKLSNECYREATEIAKASLSSTHPIRLGLALNYSVYYYEILNKPEQACQLAKAAFDEAICQIDQLNEESYKDSTLIMQLLRDNLTLWTSNSEVEDDVKNNPEENA